MKKQSGSDAHDICELTEYVFLFLETEEMLHLFRDSVSPGASRTCIRPRVPHLRYMYMCVRNLIGTIKNIYTRFVQFPRPISGCRKARLGMKLATPSYTKLLKSIIIPRVHNRRERRVSHSVS